VLLYPKVGNRHEIIGAADDSADRDDDEVDQRVLDLPTRGSVRLAK